MDSALKHRLIGAAVLSALAIIFLPMLIVGKDRNDTASTVPLKVPSAPAGDFETKELPLTAPGSSVPDGGVVGMDTSHPAASPAASPAMSPAVDASGATPASPASGTSAAAASPVTPQPASVAAGTATPPAAASPASSKPATTAVTAATVAPANAASQPSNTAASPAATNTPSVPIPATSAGGQYVVSLGTYSNAGNAQSLVASLNAKQLPAYAETVMVAGKSETRVRIGPFQQRGDAEAARLKAKTVRNDMPASVTALDAATPAPLPAAPVVATKPGVASAGMKPTASTAASGKTPLPAAVASSASDKPPSPAASGRGYAVQVVAFRSEDQAVALRNKLRAAGFIAFSEKIQAESGTMYRVRIGPEADRDAADRLRNELSTKMNMSGVVVAYP